MSSAFRARRRIPRRWPAEIRALGRKAWAHAVDVADAAAVSAAAEKILAEAGKVDILVNNAGVTRDGLLMRMSDADWDTVLDTNLKGAFLVTKAFSRAMIKARTGRIINISSVIGLIGNAGQCNYAASKAGLIGFTQSVARELASRGITVNAIAPGFIETDMTSGAEGGNAGGLAEADSPRQPWIGGRYCGRGVVFGRSGGALYHRAGADGGRRDGHVNKNFLNQGLTIPAFMA